MGPFLQRTLSLLIIIFSLCVILNYGILTSPAVTDMLGTAGEHTWHLAGGQGVWGLLPSAWEPGCAVVMNQSVPKGKWRALYNLAH